MLDAYRTCEFATLAKDGTPIAWPTSGLVRPDGTILLTTSLAYPQKAFNVRRDPRVALLFSDPTGSGLEDPEQILITGTASCPDELHTTPSGDLADFWRMILTRQPKSGAYLDWPATMLTDFYFMRLLIDVTPTARVTRPLPSSRNVVDDRSLIGGEVLASYPTAVLAGVDSAGAPLLVRTTLTSVAGGYLAAVPDDVALVDGPASLLVHRHDDQLWNMHNASIRGTLKRGDDGWLLTPARLTEPAARHRASLADPIRTVRTCRAATKRYLAKRNWDRPAIPWSAYRAIRTATRPS